ncbi:hypothetical protein PPL_04096 [Heterostelium album PN500]|uniref:TraB family protein n=1 Tax=Heterostelium pallidum (strain ATCC 26659 / Pp 5 / PN500) TaxID=670386 RepID=D3B608_HETP5|nr:hypothetical protein PPL_04096 [Heterostelium album PN500]EFA83306.1 hypothetical protein PPL_04096 [Heterostelium album PN500]|eukprot:XP_020435423.1 hypothetical protein PPL_04096 [Heterostelium album PN500]
MKEEKKFPIKSYLDCVKRGFKSRQVRAWTYLWNLLDRSSGIIEDTKKAKRWTREKYVQMAEKFGKSTDGNIFNGLVDSGSSINLLDQSKVPEGTQRHKEKLVARAIESSEVSLLILNLLPHLIRDHGCESILGIPIISRMKFDYINNVFTLDDHPNLFKLKIKDELTHHKVVETTMLDPRSNKDVFVIGTSHISKRSANQVKQFIRDVKPDTVVLELCQQRYNKLKDEQHVKNIEPYQATRPMQSIMMEVMAMIRSGRGSPGDILALLMKNYYNTFRVMGIVPGLEFKFAINEADLLGSKIELGDLPVNDTMRNLASTLMLEALPLLGGNQMMGGMMGNMMNGMMGNMMNGMNQNQNQQNSEQVLSELARLSNIMLPLANVLSKPTVTEEELEKEFKNVMTNANLQEMRAIFSKNLPKTFNAFLLDRERNITSTILNSKGNKVLAVVGAMHVQGIKDMLNNK